MAVVDACADRFRCRRGLFWRASGYVTGMSRTGGAPRPVEQSVNKAQALGETSC